MRNDMKKPVTVNLCVCDYSIAALFRCLPPVYLSIFQKLFKMTFLSAHGDFILLEPLSFGNPGIVNGRSFYAVNCTMVLNRVNCRSLVAVIHSINIAASNEKAKGFENNYMDLDSLSFSLTKILLYKY